MTAIVPMADGGEGTMEALVADMLNWAYFFASSVFTRFGGISPRSPATRFFTDRVAYAVLDLTLALARWGVRITLSRSAKPSLS